MTEQMVLEPKSDPSCTRNLAVWTEADGTKGQMCCCLDCTQVREEALVLDVGAVQA